MADPASQPLVAWFASRWVLGAGFMGVALLTLAPLLTQVLPFALFLLFLHSPGYMLHQVEEHTGDRFRIFVNQRIFGGLNVLSVEDVLVINLPLVWGVNLGALYAAWEWGLGYGLVAPYAVLVNALAHFGVLARFKAYNPGVLTSVFIFLPLGLLTIWTTGASPSVHSAHHVIGLGLALLIHAVIIANAFWRLALLRNQRNHP